MMNWKDVIDLIQKFNAGISIFLNTILTFLIILKSPKQLGSYKYLMLYISSFEIVYSILDVVVSPIIFSHQSIFLVMVYTKDSLVFSPNILLILDGIYCAFFGASMGMFALHFVYRYFVSVGSKYLKTFNDYRIIYWLMIPIIYGSIWGSLSYFLLGPSSQIDHQMSSKLMSTFSWNIEDIVYLGPYFYQLQSDGSHQLDIVSFLVISIAWGIIGSSLIAIIYFGVRCYLKLCYLMSLKSNNSSYNFKNLQSQLFYALVSQTLIPVILMHVPLSIVFIFTFLNKDLGTLSGITSITISLFPALDPLPTMFIIKSYRNTILGCFRKIKTNNNDRREASFQLSSVQNTA